MASVTLKNIKKIYPNTSEGKKGRKKKKKEEHVSDEPKANLQITEQGVVAVQQFSLDIADKEFIVLVGPSGCGKSTTLRMIAGLEEITEGELYIGDKLMNDVAPKDRDIAMVFQNYALYPHMTVYENIPAAVEVSEMMGSEQHLHLRAGDTEMMAIVPTSGSGNVAQTVEILFSAEHIHLFSPETERSLLGGLSD